MPTFIHAADIHLDSPLRGLSAYQDAPAEQLRNATRLAFTGLISEAIDRKVDFVVIAGDLYDGDIKDFQTAHFFAREMGRLGRSGIDAYVLYGNHDAEAGNQSSIPWPPNTHIFPSKAPATFLRDDGIALHGQSYAVRDTTHDMTAAYPTPAGGAFNIGVLHTALDTGGPNSAHANYAAVSVETLIARGYDYWALGHVHSDRIAHETPWVVFPGNLQGRHIKETGPKGARLVEVIDGRVTKCERLYCDVLRWEHVSADVSSCESMERAQAVIREALNAALNGADRPLAVRLSLVGETPMHGDLVASESLSLRNEVLAIAIGLDPDRLWIEKVVVATEAPASGFFDAPSDSALSELRNILTDKAKDAALLGALREDIIKLVGSSNLNSAEMGEIDALLLALPDVVAREADSVIALLKPMIGEADNAI